MIKLWNENVPLFNTDFQNEENKDAPSIIPCLINDGKKHSAVIVCPGGRYNHKSEKEALPIAKWLNSLNINAFVLDYRVFPYTHPAHILDLKRAIRYIRYNHKEFNISPDNVGVMGFSAGGHLAGIVSEHFDEFDIANGDEIDKISARPDMLCLCYPVVSMVETYGHLPSMENFFSEPNDLIVTLSLEKGARSDMPPTFIWHTAEDESVNVINSLELSKALKNNNVPFELHVFPKGGHGLNLAQDIEGVEQWSNLYKNWLNNIHFII